MPSTSRAQRALFAIAEHHPEELHKENKGLANLPHQTLHDFAATKETGLPAHVAHYSSPASYPTPAVKGVFSLIHGSTPSIMGANTSTFKNAGQSEFDATRNALSLAAKKPRKSTHANLGKFLHPRSDGKPHGSPKE